MRPDRSPTLLPGEAPGRPWRTTQPCRSGQMGAACIHLEAARPPERSGEARGHAVHRSAPVQLGGPNAQADALADRSPAARQLPLQPVAPAGRPGEILGPAAEALRAQSQIRSGQAAPRGGLPHSGSINPGRYGCGPGSGYQSGAAGGTTSHQAPCGRGRRAWREGGAREGNDQGLLEGQVHAGRRRRHMGTSRRASSVEKRTSR